MADRKVAASAFKAKCLALLDQVADTRINLVVTKRGRPVARVVPVDQGGRKQLKGSVKLRARRDEEYFSTGEAWDASEPDL